MKMDKNTCACITNGEHNSSLTCCCRRLIMEVDDGENRSEQNVQCTSVCDISQQSMLNSSIVSNESDLSFICGGGGAGDKDTFNKSLDDDELPPFELHVLSPMSRSPSPIRNDCDGITAYNNNNNNKENESIFSNGVHSHSDDDSILSTLSDPRHDSPHYVAIKDINIRLCEPNDNIPCSSSSHNNSLETIYEDKMLYTPPKKHNFAHSSPICRKSLLEKTALLRLQKRNTDSKLPPAEVLGDSKTKHLIKSLHEEYDKKMKIDEI